MAEPATTAHRKKQRLHASSSSSSSSASSATSAAGGGPPRASWRAIPNDALGIISALLGKFECGKASHAQAIRAVLPSALTSIEVHINRWSSTSQLTQLAMAMLEDVQDADHARVAQALAAQTTWRQVTLHTIEYSVAGAVGEALEANNAEWKALALVGDMGSQCAELAVLERLEHNHVLEKLHVEGEVSVENAEAIGRALRWQGSRLRELRVVDRLGMHGPSGVVDLLMSVAQGVAQSRTLRRLEVELEVFSKDLDLAGKIGASLEQEQMRPAEALGQMLRAQEVPLEVVFLRVDSGLSDRAAAAIVEGLARNNTLREFELRTFVGGDATCRALAAALAFEGSALRRLDLKSNGRMHDVAAAVVVAALRRNNVLRELDLSNCNVGARTVNALAAELASGSSALRSLTLDGNHNYVDGFDDAAGAKLGRSLASNSTLRRLDLTSCGLGVATCRALAIALASPSLPLSSLILSCNTTIGDAGGAALAEGLKRNATLRHLDLALCCVGVETCRALGAALALEGSALDVLDLFGNEAVGDAGGAVLAEGLKRNATFRRLELSNCGIGNATCFALATALAFKGTALDFLRLSGNKDVNDVGGVALAEGLKPNATIRTFNVGNCGITNAIPAIAAALKVSTSHPAFK